MTTIRILDRPQLWMCDTSEQSFSIAFMNGLLYHTPLCASLFNTKEAQDICSYFTHVSPDKKPISFKCIVRNLSQLTSKIYKESIYNDAKFLNQFGISVDNKYIRSRICMFHNSVSNHMGFIIFIMNHLLQKYNTDVCGSIWTSYKCRSSTCGFNKHYAPTESKQILIELPDTKLSSLQWFK